MTSTPFTFDLVLLQAKDALSLPTEGATKPCFVVVLLPHFCRGYFTPLLSWLFSHSWSGSPSYLGTYQCTALTARSSESSAAPHTGYQLS